MRVMLIIQLHVSQSPSTHTFREISKMSFERGKKKVNLRSINIEGLLDFGVVTNPLNGSVTWDWVFSSAKSEKHPLWQGRLGQVEDSKELLALPREEEFSGTCQFQIYVCSRVRSLGTKSSAQKWDFLFALFHDWPDPSPASSKAWSLVACLLLWNNYAFGNTDKRKI